MLTKDILIQFTHTCKKKNRETPFIRDIINEENIRAKEEMFKEFKTIIRINEEMRKAAEKNNHFLIKRLL